jgi:hypothetical protein
MAASVLSLAPVPSRVYSVAPSRLRGASSIERLLLCRASASYLLNVCYFVGLLPIVRLIQFHANIQPVCLHSQRMTTALWVSVQSQRRSLQSVMCTSADPHVPCTPCIAVHTCCRMAHATWLRGLGRRGRRCRNPAPLAYHTGDRPICDGCCLPPAASDDYLLVCCSVAPGHRVSAPRVSAPCMILPQPQCLYLVLGLSVAVCTPVHF